MGIMKRQSTTESMTSAEADYASIRAVVACSIVMSIFATIFVWFRISIRRSRSHLEVEDWLIIACLPFMYATATTALIAVFQGGLGYPLLTLFAKDPGILSTSLECLFAMEILYSILITLIKVSVLAMYRSIFPTVLVDKGTLLLGVLVMIWWFAVMLVTFLQCRPLNGVWDLSAIATAQCMDKLGLFLGNAIPNIIIDILILALPLYEVAALQMTFAKKAGVLAIFLLGGLTVVISGLRLQSGMSLLGNPNADFTLMVGPLWAWTVVEPAMGIVCACLPTVGGHLVGVLVRMITTPKPTQRNDSTSKKSTLKTIATIGGSSAKAINRPAFSKNNQENGSGSFERLNDDSGEASPTDLWPQGYQVERDTNVSGRRSPSERGDDIPLTSITVKQEMSWSESKAACESAASQG